MQSDRSRLVILRHRLDIGQREFSPLFGMGASALGAIECGQRKMTRIHRALLCSLELIVDNGLQDDLYSAITEQDDLYSAITEINK